MAALVIAGGDSTEVLQPVNSTLDDVAPLIVFGIEGRWAASSAAAFETVFFRILALRTDAPDSTSLNQLSRLPGTICLIDPQAGRTLFRAARPNARNGNRIQHRGQLGDIGALASSDGHRQRAGISVHTQVNLAG
jgi:hypothetical protein